MKAKVKTWEQLSNEYEEIIPDNNLGLPNKKGFKYINTKPYAFDSVIEKIIPKNRIIKVVKSRKDNVFIYKHDNCNYFLSECVFEDLSETDLMSSFEFLFNQWLSRAKELGYILEEKYQPETFIVLDEKKIPFGFSFKKVEYTPDWLIIFSDRFFIDFPNIRKRQIKNKTDNKIYVDIKSTFNGKFTSSNREFPYNQRLMYDRYGIYVEKILLDRKINWFADTFASAEMAYKRNNKGILTSELKKDFRNVKIL